MNLAAISDMPKPSLGTVGVPYVLVIFGWHEMREQF